MPPRNLNVFKNNLTDARNLSHTISEHVQKPIRERGERDLVTSLWLPRAAIASVWLYQGLWRKLLGGMPHHREIFATVPFFNTLQAGRMFMALGVLECVIAAW